MSTHHISLCCDSGVGDAGADGTGIRFGDVNIPFIIRCVSFVKPNDSASSMVSNVMLNSLHF